MKSSSPLLLMMLCFAVTACGQPGPLYLPSEKTAATSGNKQKSEQPRPKSEEPKIDSETDQYDPF